MPGSLLSTEGPTTLIRSPNGRDEVAGGNCRRGCRRQAAGTLDGAIRMLILAIALLNGRLALLFGDSSLADCVGQQFLKKPEPLSASHCLGNNCLARILERGTEIQGQADDNVGENPSVVG